MNQAIVLGLMHANRGLRFIRTQLTRAAGDQAVAIRNATKAFVFTAPIAFSIAPKLAGMAIMFRKCPAAVAETHFAGGASIIR